jgi:hypothetical protein
MTTTLDEAGRVIIPVEVRSDSVLPLEWSLRWSSKALPSALSGAVAGPPLVRRGKRLVAQPRAAEGERIEVDVARFLEEERDRWPS